jgi:hypothetical protein
MHIILIFEEHFFEDSTGPQAILLQAAKAFYSIPTMPLHTSQKRLIRYRMLSAINNPQPNSYLNRMMPT